MAKKILRYTIGLDIGGTKIAGVLFDGARVVSDSTLATPKDNYNHFLVMANAVIEPLRERAKEDKAVIDGIGIGIAGELNKERRKVYISPNIPIIDKKEVAASIEEMTGLRVIMDNDVNCFLRAEMLMGIGIKYENAYGIIIGTGIGGAWWFNKGIYRGAHGGGGEPGEMMIGYDPLVRLEPAYHKLTQNNPEQMADEAFRGDALAQRSYEELGTLLGTAFANLVNLLDPEVIIIGGGTIEASDLFLANANKFMREHITSPEAKKVKILKTKLGKKAGAIGAALMIKAEE